VAKKQQFSASLEDAAEEWDLAMRAGNKSIATRKVYGTAVAQFDTWLAGQGRAGLMVDQVTPHDVRAFLADVLERTSESTAITRYGGLQAFYKWCRGEGLTETDPTDLPEGKPRRGQPTVPVLQEDDLRAVLATCGRDFNGVRDEAIMRMLLGTGMRRGECAAIRLEDLDAKRQTVHIVRGKGNKGRVVFFPDHAAVALRRYLRARATHRLAHSTDRLWLGKEGPLGGSGIQQMLQGRVARAGVSARMNPHSFRHTFAHAWLAAGGTEGALMASAGWANRSMIDRYGRSAAAARAHAEAARLNIGDGL